MTEKTVRRLIGFPTKTKVAALHSIGRTSTTQVMNSSAHHISPTSITPSFLIEVGIQLRRTEDLK